jgi:hypothetical protein
MSRSVFTVRATAAVMLFTATSCGGGQITGSRSAPSARRYQIAANANPIPDAQGIFDQLDALFFGRDAELSFENQSWLQGRAIDCYRAPDGPVCGDGICSAGEEGRTCGKDCCDQYTDCWTTNWMAARTRGSRSTKPRLFATAS